MKIQNLTVSSLLPITRLIVAIVLVVTSALGRSGMPVPIAILVGFLMVVSDAKKELRR
jgi:hypothetical protein